MTRIKWLVSTLITTYNAENFLKDTLNSVLNQTYKNQEILIWDDWSSDRTIDLLKKYKKLDSRINFWISKEEWKKWWFWYWWLNFLLDKSKWEFVAIQDHDDIWHPNKLEKQVEFLINNNKYKWCSTRHTSYYYNEKIFIEWKIRDWFFHTTLIFRYSDYYRYDLTKEEADVYLMKNTIKDIFILDYNFVLWRRFWKNNLSYNRWYGNMNFKKLVLIKCSELLNYNVKILFLYTKIKNFFWIKNYIWYTKNQFIKKNPGYKKYIK